jgi:hypothetical protein
MLAFNKLLVGRVIAGLCCSLLRMLLNANQLSWRLFRVSRLTSESILLGYTQQSMDSRLQPAVSTCIPICIPQIHSRADKCRRVSMVFMSALP